MFQTKVAWSEARHTKIKINFRKNWFFFKSHGGHHYFFDGILWFFFCKLYDSVNYSAHKKNIKIKLSKN